MSKWKWFSGLDEEFFTEGPFDTKEEAIQEALDNDAFNTFFDEATGEWMAALFVIEAQREQVRMSQFVTPLSIARILEDAGEEIDKESPFYGDFDDSLLFSSITAEQEDDLKQFICDAIDNWQDSHGLVFEPKTFTRSRNMEEIIRDIPE
jgi:hypothetical protein